MSRSAIVTVAIGQATEKLDYTFASFAMTQGVELHAFILGERLPERRVPEIQYHLITPIPDYSHPLREVYFRRHALIDELSVDYALVVDCFDVLCLQPLPAFEPLLANCAVAGCVEHAGSRYILGQGYTSNFLNGGLTLWNVARSLEIRREITERGKRRFRTVADDQFVINEVLMTKYYDQVRILPCQYNFRAHYRIKQRGWPTVNTLDGVVVYHNATCMDAVKRLPPVKARAELPPLMADARPLTPKEQFWRRLRQRFIPYIAK